MAEQRLTAAETIEAYTEMRTLKPNSSILAEVRLQYLDMATGGNGYELGYKPTDFEGCCGDYGPTCREYNYPGYPDEFFQTVVEGMEWK